MKKLFLFALAIVSSTMIVACDKGSSGSSNNDNVGYYPTCVRYQNGVCYDGNGNVINGNPQVSFYDYNYYAGDGWGTGSLTITNQSVYMQFLENVMGVCNQWTYVTGSYDCSNWTNSFVTLSLKAPSTTSSTADIAVRLDYNGTVWGGYAGTKKAIYGQNPMVIGQGAVSVINNYQGFDVRKTVYLGLVQFIVKQGKLNDGSMAYELAYGNKNTGSQVQVFATGILTRSPYGN